MKTMKRTLSEQSSSPLGSAKKVKTLLDPKNYLHKTLQESGLCLKHPPDKCKTTQESIHVIRSIKKNLEKHFEYPSNVTELFVSLEKECQNSDVFKHYLFPNIVRVSGDSVDEYAINDSVLKILLNIPLLQNKLVDYIFEKAIDLAALSECEPWIQMILKCFSALDSVVDMEKISSNLVNLLDIASEKMVRLEIITAIPDIIGDQEHNNISMELSRILSEDHELVPAILECLSYLCLSDDQYELLQKKTLNILLSLSKCNYFPNFVKFLLIPSRMSDSAYLEAVQGLRNALGWSASMAKPQDIASSQVLTATAIRNSMISSKNIANSWLKVVSNCKINTDHKPIDLVILLILFSTSEEKQKQVENVIKKQIKFDTLRVDLLDEAYEKFKPMLKHHLKHMMELANSLLKNKSDPVVESFATYMYTLIFSKLKECCQTVVAELLQLGLDSKQCVMSILHIMNTVASKDMFLLKPQSVQMLTLLDRMDNMTLDEVRAVMNLLCGLAYSCENSVIRDDLQMIIRKELCSSNPKIKIQGILAGVHAVKYLTASNDDNVTREMPDNISYGSTTHLPEGDLREAAQIIEMISTSTKPFPDMIAFFYDELSKIVSDALFINQNFMSWLTDAVVNDLQQNFVIDSLQTQELSDLKLCMQYCLNADSEIEEDIAINIAGLTLQSENGICIGILSPLFQLVQILHCKQYEGNLSNIDALLGCAIVMPKFDIDLIEDIDSCLINSILDCLVHCVNWFRELLNAFTAQDDNILREKILKRVLQVEELERVIGIILIKSKVSYKPPVSTFNINKYTGEHIVNKPVNIQNIKQKPQKKNVGEDNVLPESSRSQATQPNYSYKNKIDTINNINFRQLNFNLLQLLQLNLTNEKESDNKLTVKMLNFILVSINRNLEHTLVSKIKRRTFLTKQEVTSYDPKKAETCAKLVNEALPKLLDHMQFLTSFLENQISTSRQNDNDILCNTEIMEYLSCLENIYIMLTIFFKWIGFRNQNNALLKTSLRTVASSDSAILSLKDLLKVVAEKFENHETYCLQLSTAVALVELINAIQSFSDSEHILRIMRNTAQNFLSQQWKTLDGDLERGLLFNQRVDRLASIYFLNKEVLALKKLTEHLTTETQNLKSRNVTLNTLKCINKANFPILYRNLGTAIYEATKSSLTKGMTNSEHLGLWNDVATIMKHMSDIAKALDNRNNLSAFFKKSLPLLKLFISQGMPILELQFKTKTQEVIEILKILQQSTRFLQTLCCHSRLKKDTALMSKVPFMRQLLETLIYKVKAALAANKCSEAFWMGNLKNKNIHGEIIATQQSIDGDESVENCDDQLPEEDEIGESEDEMPNPETDSVSDLV